VFRGRFFSGGRDVHPEIIRFATIPILLPPPPYFITTPPQTPFPPNPKNYKLPIKHHDKAY